MKDREKKVNNNDERKQEDDLFRQVRKIEMLTRVPEELYPVAADVIAFVYRTESQSATDGDIKEKSDA